MHYLANLLLASIAGGFFGIVLTISIIAGFSEMILSSIFNLYYASIFFIVGSYYTYKIIKKNQIQLSLENDAGIPVINQNINGFGSKKKKDEIQQPGTGGSFSSATTMGSLQLDFTKTNDKTIFSRVPLITETQALYQQSAIFSDNGNTNINKLNSFLEIILTLFIFISSFLVISIEKYWWDDKIKIPVYFQDSQILEKYKREFYAINNLLRLVIVACSISFFMMISWLEISQSIATTIYGAAQSMKHKMNKNKEGQEKEKMMTQVQIEQKSQLIVSNVQMLVVLLSVCLYGTIFGMIQAAMDPENHRCAFAIVFNIHYEIQESQPIGMILGIIFGFILEFLRQKEIQYRPKTKGFLEQNLFSPALERGDSGHSKYDADEEKMSLISMPEGGPRQSYENLILKTDSDEDSESDEQLLMRASVDFLAKF